MTEGLLYTAYAAKHDYLSDACIYSLNPISEAEKEALQEAQAHLEAMWLGQFPSLIAIVDIEDIERHDDAVLLFDDTYLLLSEAWDILDDMEIFLINKELYVHFFQTDPPYINLDRAGTYAGLTEKFEDMMFVVAVISRNAITQNQKCIPTSDQAMV